VVEHLRGGAVTEGVRQVCASQYRMHIKKVQCTKCSEALCNKCSLEVDKKGAAYQVALACAPVCGAALLSGAVWRTPRCASPHTPRPGVARGALPSAFRCLALPLSTEADGRCETLSLRAIP
jgi:hypothetical protein